MDQCRAQTRKSGVACDLNLTVFCRAYYPLLNKLSCLFPAIRVKEAQQGVIDEEAEDRS
jgi:hypothetical protein